MNRAQLVQTIAACDALAAELRKALRADAAAEYEEQGTAPTWRLPGFTVSASITRDRVEIVDSGQFMAWLQARFPTEVYEERRLVVRNAEWMKNVLDGLASRHEFEDGEKVADDEGTVVPGLKFAAGGEFHAVAIVPNSATRATLRGMAAEIVAGRRPLALPGVSDVA